LRMDWAWRGPMRPAPIRAMLREGFCEDIISFKQREIN
jgi:hypothetical protein